MMTAKRKWGDRRDGVWIDRTDSMHLFMPYLYPKRTGAEALVEDEVDAGALLEYIAKKNEGRTEDKYTVFHAVIMALMKTVKLRPQLNRFYKGGRLYQRNELSVSFVAKKKFEDGAEESLLSFKCRDGECIDDMHDRIYSMLNRVRRHNENDKSTDVIGVLCRFPRPIVYLIMRIFRILDFFGWMPDALVSDDPHFTTVWLTNLGSIKLHANYHHLNEWGTNSIFVVVSEMYDKLVSDGQGGVTTMKMLPFAVTLDERIADGYYYSKCMKLIKYLLTHPELLDKPVEEEVDPDA